MQSPQKIIIPIEFMERVEELGDKNKIKRVISTVVKFKKQGGRGKNLHLHRVKDSRIENLWSIYASQKDLRIFLQKVDDSWAFVHVGTEHDGQYHRVENMLKPLGRTPETGHVQALPSLSQIEEITESFSPVNSGTPIFETWDDSCLLRLGVPNELLGLVRKISDQNELAHLKGILDELVFERLSILAQGGEVVLPEPVKQGESPFDNPESQQRFFVVSDDQDLEHLLHQLLEGKWEKWLTFLHPSQRNVAYGSYSGPVRVTGSAGTGKTVVALHRAKHLASLGKDVLLTTFTTTLSNNLSRGLDLLCSAEVRGRIKADNVHNVARTILDKAGKNVEPVKEDQQLEKIFRKALGSSEAPYSMEFLIAEWEGVIDPQGIQSWDDYRVAVRKGRALPLRVRERREIWKIFERVQNDLRIGGKTTYPGLCRLAREALETGKVRCPWQAVIVDEVQDLGRQELLLLKAIGGSGCDGVMVTGDSGQRIYPSGFSLSALGIETRGRSFILKVNYRSSLEIKLFSEKIISPVSDDLDGGTVPRDDTISLFFGPEPELHRAKNQGEQASEVARRIKGAVDRGDEPGSMAVFSRTNHDLRPIEQALKEEGISTLRLKEDQSLADLRAVRLGTMHSAKGLEFRTVFVVGVSSRNLPHPKAIEGMKGEEREAAIDRERNLLYVAVTRARDQVHIFWFGAPSPFLTDSGLVS